MHVIHIDQGPLIATLTERLADLGVTSAAIVSLIGAVDEFTVSTMPADDASTDIVTTYTRPAEMHGAGEVVNGEPHLHVTMAIEGDQGIAGHLHEAEVGHWFARVYVLPT
ncbi:PCC domain-containing protein [Actinomadura atramentaria]|uniref:PCC domain-containing protein n=1 Tax=Actinomadura atramentaria TaxID=1990 RepID=UPI001969F5D2|nr:DUF296 domain-containing protein [Actinomadura atramentaria]